MPWSDYASVTQQEITLQSINRFKLLPPVGVLMKGHTPLFDVGGHNRVADGGRQRGREAIQQMIMNYVPPRTASWSSRTPR
jgi:hypothetical protein